MNLDLRAFARFSYLTRGVATLFVITLLEGLSVDLQGADTIESLKEQRLKGQAAIVRQAIQDYGEGLISMEDALKEERRLVKLQRELGVEYQDDEAYFAQLVTIEERYRQLIGRRYRAGDHSISSLDLQRAGLRLLKFKQRLLEAQGGDVASTGDVSVALTSGAVSDREPSATIEPVPEGMHGISGLVSARLIEKDNEQGDVVFELERIHRLWRGNKASNARSGEGKILRLKGITGRALDQLLLIEKGDRFSIEIKHVRGDHLLYLGEGLKRLNEGELPAEGLGEDNRSFMHGFRGIFVGELQKKDPEKGTFSVKIESIKRVWKANKAIQASLADGQVWDVRGVSGKWVDVLLEIGVGERIEVEAFHNSGDKLDFVGEWLRRPEEN